MLNKIENILRMGPVKSVSFITITCVLMSVAIVLFTFFVFGREVQGIVLLLAVIVPLIIASIASSILIKLILKEEQEKRRIYKESAKEAKNILSNFLHDVQYFESVAEIIGGFDGKTMQNLEGALKKTQDRLDSLDDVDDLTAEHKIIT